MRLVNVPVQHRDRAELLEVGQRLRAVFRAPAPLRVHAPQGNVREHDDRRAVLQMLDVVFQPFELLAAERAEAAGLQVQHVHQPDEVHAFRVEAVPPGSLGALSVAFQILFAVIVEHVVFARHEEHVFALALFRIWSTVSNSSGFERWLISPVCSMNSGGVGRPLILSTAAFSVPTTSGFAALLNPMWLSLICTKLSSPADAGLQPRHFAQAVRLQDAALHDKERSGSGPRHAFQESPPVDSVIVVIVQQLVILFSDILGLSWFADFSSFPLRACHQARGGCCQYGLHSRSRQWTDGSPPLERRSPGNRHSTDELHDAVPCRRSGGRVVRFQLQVHLVMEADDQVGGRLCFGVFELDLRAGELRKRGLRVRLQQQPFQVLAMLLERAGEVVGREELQKRLWPADTFVDFDHGLNKAINKIREALGDSAESPRFVETVARRGYRFIADVRGCRCGSLLAARTSHLSLIPRQTLVIARIPPATLATLTRRLPPRAWTISTSCCSHCWRLSPPGSFVPATVRRRSFAPWLCFRWKASRAMRLRITSLTG